VLKLGSDAPWLTAADSAERSVLPVAEPDAATEAVAPEELELEPELLDEHAASRSAAAVTASAAVRRRARDLRNAPCAPP
jgi:hypothetical protein